MISDGLRLRLESPYFAAMCRDGTSWPLTLSNVASFREAWMAGRPFWSGTNVWGEAVDIKLADITGCAVKTEESLALRAEERDEETRRGLIS